MHRQLRDHFKLPPDAPMTTDFVLRVGNLGRDRFALLMTAVQGGSARIRFEAHVFQHQDYTMHALPAFHTLRRAEQLVGALGFHSLAHLCSGDEVDVDHVRAREAIWMPMLLTDASGSGWQHSLGASLQALRSDRRRRAPPTPTDALIDVARAYLQEHLGIGIQTRSRQRDRRQHHTLCVRPTVWHYHERLRRSRPVAPSAAACASASALVDASDSSSMHDANAAENEDDTEGVDYAAEKRLGEHVWSLVQTQARATWAHEQQQQRTAHGLSATHASVVAPPPWYLGSVHR
jgi:hypothetical protein